MKKMMTFLLALALTLSLAACGNGGKRPTEIPEKERAQEDQPGEESSLPAPIRCHVETLFSRNGFRVTSEEIPSLNCTVLLPESWNGKWDLCVEPSGVRIFCAEARDDFTRWDDSSSPGDENLLMGRIGGMLFYMEWRQGDYTSYAPGLLKVLRKNETVLVEMDYARDVQYTDETAELYQAMTADVDQIQFLFDN